MRHGHSGADCAILARLPMSADGHARGTPAARAGRLASESTAPERAAALYRGRSLDPDYALARACRALAEVIIYDYEAPDAVLADTLSLAASLCPVPAKMPKFPASLPGSDASRKLSPN
jgi:hypothetical protein